jgi:hypothetical protein
VGLLRRRRPRPVLDENTRAWLLELVSTGASFFGDGDTEARYETLRCQFCQGVHFRACPRVREVEYGDGGQVRRVKFWGQGSYDDSYTIWPEDVYDEADAAEVDSTA